MSDELKDKINSIVDNGLEKLSIDELILLKKMIIYYDIYDNKDVEERKER